MTAGPARATTSARETARRGPRRGVGPLVVLLLGSLLGVLGWGPAGSASAAPLTVVPQRLAAARLPAHLTVTALGDSVTTGGPCPCAPFPGRYAARLAARRGVPTTSHNEGVNGLTSGRLLPLLYPAGSATATAVAGADVVLVTIGANDFNRERAAITGGECLKARHDCVADELAALRRNLAAILDRIRALRSGRPTRVLVTGYWDVFRDGAVADRDYAALGRRNALQVTRRANYWIEQVAQHHRVVYVDLDGPFHSARGGVTPLLYTDGDHPSAAGHRLIAGRLMAAAGG